MKQTGASVVLRTSADDALFTLFEPEADEEASQQQPDASHMLLLFGPATELPPHGTRVWTSPQTMPRRSP